MVGYFISSHRPTLQRLLDHGEHIIELVGADQSTVSKHLAVLKNAGLVADRKEASMSYYRMTCPCLDGFFLCMESVLKQNLKTQQMVLTR